MSAHTQEYTFKKIGSSIEHAFLMLNEGITLVDSIDKAEDEAERELYTKLASVQVHHSWHSLLRVFRKIAIEVDRGIPKGSGAQKRLIEQMMQRTNARPGILSLRHCEVALQLSEFHRDFRNARRIKHSRREVIHFIETMSDEIVPSVLENVRTLAMVSPRGSKLIGYLKPKTDDPEIVQYEDVQRA